MKCGCAHGNTVRNTSAQCQLESCYLTFFGYEMVIAYFVSREAAVICAAGVPTLYKVLARRYKLYKMGQGIGPQLWERKFIVRMIQKRSTYADINTSLAHG